MKELFFSTKAGFEYVDARRLMLHTLDQRNVDDGVCSFVGPLCLDAINRHLSESRNIKLVVDLSQFGMEDVTTSRFSSELPTSTNGNNIYYVYATESDNNWSSLLEKYTTSYIVCSQISVKQYGAGEKLSETELSAIYAEKRDLTSEIINKSWKSFGEDDNNEPIRKRLTSTPVLGEGYYDAQAILTNPYDYSHVIFSLYDLYRNVNIKSNYTIKFLAMSLRAAPLVGALSNIADLGFSIIGPGVHDKIISEYVANPLNSRVTYILVSDFVVGGTELKIAQAFATHRQSNIALCICLAKLLNEDEYSRGIKVKSLKNIEERKFSL